MALLLPTSKVKSGGTASGGTESGNSCLGSSQCWFGPVAWTDNQLLARKDPVRPSLRPCDRACAFLEDALEDGPRTVRELWPLAEAQGLAERTLQRAKQTTSE